MDSEGAKGRSLTPTGQMGLRDDFPELRNAECSERCLEGDKAVEREHLKAGEVAYRAALSADEHSIHALHNLGVVYYLMEEWERAVSCFERSVELDPKDSDLRFKLGLCTLMSGEAKVASEQFEITTGVDPGHSGAQYQLALLHASGKAPGSEGRSRAIEALKEILKAADKGQPCDDLHRACFLLGSLLDDTPENRESAVAVYRRGLQEDPFFAPGHNNLGVLLMEEGQTIPALREFKIAIHLEPDYTLPYRNLARLLFDRMDIEEMEQEYTSIIEEFGVRSASVLSRLSRELTNLGRVQVYESLYTRGHQIKNLMGIAGSRIRRLIRNHPSSDGMLEELKEIAAEQERIYDDWVAYLRSMKQETMNPGLVDVAQLAEKVTRSLSGQKGAKVLRFKSKPGIPQVKADAGALREAFTNLILNALEAAPEEGNVIVRTGYDTKQNTVFVEIEDDGPGIPEAMQKRIFDPGYSTKEKGSGYGLSIAAQIVAGHRGNLQASSNQHFGTVFRIDLPIDFEIAPEERGIAFQDPSHRLQTEEFVD